MRVAVLVRRVHHVLVRLIGDDKCVEPMCQREDHVQLGAREYFSSGIARVAQNDCLRPKGKRTFQLCRVEREVGWAQGNPNGFRAGENRVRPVVLVEGREDDDLVTGIAGGHHRHHHRFRSAAGHHQMLVWIDRYPTESRDLACQCVAESL